MSNRQRIGRTIFIIAGGLALVGLAAQRNPVPKSANTAAPMTYSEVADAFEAQRKVNLSKIALNLSAIRVSQFNVWEGPFTVKNQTGIAVKDLVITCEFLGKSGTPVDKRSVKIFERFPPGSERKTHKITIGIINAQAASYRCEPSDLDYDLSGYAKSSPNRG